ncbi:MAG TPA: ABC transporter substrate-binding protein [Gemmatimonadaceae bacterium]|nr:ABC transporter substrate-binding protein [Gemmatimonadaceae bacterium]
MSLRGDDAGAVEPSCPVVLLPIHPLSRSFVFVALAVVLSCGGPARDEYVLGASGPWTPGFGQMNRRGIELAVSEINARGGIKGVRLRVEFQDDSGQGGRATVIAQQFVDNPAISAVVGHVTSGAMLAAAKVYDGHLAAVATTASSPALTGISPWAFRVISSDSANGSELARAATALGLRRASILYESNGYGRGLANVFRNSFQGEVLSIDPIDVAIKDAEPYIAYLKQRRPDIVFVASTAEPGVVVLREARKQNLVATFMGGDGWSGVITEPASEGALIGAPFSPNDQRAEARAFVDAFQKRYQMAPDGNAALAYDATNVIASAMAEVGGERAKIRDWLANIPANDAPRGATGQIRFRTDGDPVGKSIVLTRVRGGRPTVETIK